MLNLLKPFQHESVSPALREGPRQFARDERRMVLDATTGSTEGSPSELHAGSKSDHKLLGWRGRGGERGKQA